MVSSFKVSLAVFVLLTAAFSSAHSHATDQTQEGYVADTRYGRVQGTVRYSLTSSRPVYSFFGVPYARSPDHAFRFRPPVDPWQWEGVKDATDENVPLCRQDREKLNRLRANSIKQFFFADDFPMRENCLTLNVFTPVRPDYDGNRFAQRLPVIVWIHGGSLETSSTPHQMWMMSSFEDVVVVAVQYRLGALGFMGTGDEAAPSNLGLRDLVKALQWVRDNVGEFGGDPDLVTIMGQSAGGFATSALSLALPARGLFHRVISLSGVASKPSLWAADRSQQIRNALSVARDLGCELWKNQLTMTCMRNRVTSTRFVNASRAHRFLADWEDEELFGGVASSPRAALKSGKFDARIPTMLGSVAGEYDFLLGRKRIDEYERGKRFTRSEAERLMRSEVERFFPRSKAADPEEQERLLDRIVDDYLDRNEDPGDDVAPVTSHNRHLVDFLADFHFNSHLHETALAHSAAGGKVFVYRFTHRPRFYDDGDALTIRRPHDYGRADHSDDVAFILGLPFLAPLASRGIQFTQAERLMSRRMMSHVAAFAKSGEPTSDWGQFPASHLSIDEAQLTAKPGSFAQDRMTEWTKLFDLHNR